MTQQSQNPREQKSGIDMRQLDAWLLSGGWVVASSERAARYVEVEFNRERLREGLKAWKEPTILTWASFVRRAWDEVQTTDDRMVLSAAQELQIWETIVSGSKSLAAVLPGPRRKLAGLAADAHRLLANYAPNALDRRARSGWQRDAEEMSAWLAAFDERAKRERILSANLLPLELLKILRTLSVNQNEVEKREALWLVGFDRLEPVQREVLDAWGEYERVEKDIRASRVEYFEAAELTAELAACVLWCNQKLKDNPAARLLVITSEVGERRGEIERAFARWLDGERWPVVEFSLGRPLSRIPLVHAAELMLRWLSAPLKEHELDWLFATGYAAQSDFESASLLRLMRVIRCWQRERPEWTLEQFCSVAAELIERTNAEEMKSPLMSWVSRMRTAQSKLNEIAGGEKLSARKTHLEWSLSILEVLRAMGWPGFRTLVSAEVQSRVHFEQTVEGLAALGFDERKVQWREFTDLLSQTLAETLFALESREATILIVGPAESAGLSADGIWFLGAKEGSWPSAGATNPLLPIGLQRDAGMPHATAEVDWELARSVTERVLHSAPEVRFSFPKLSGDEESKPSRLIEQMVGVASALPQELIALQVDDAQTEFVDECRKIPFLKPNVKGGAQLLTLQSNCAFKAFATQRLGAESWNDAVIGLTPGQRGNLLHKLMYAIWSGTEQGGLKGLDDLRNLAGSADDSANDEKLVSFVLKLAKNVIRREIDPELRNRLPKTYLEIEEVRLTKLVSEWLRYESAREDFDVVACEEKRTVEVGGLTLEVRIDRMDRLKDGSLLVIDYKTGDVKPKLWDLPRPEDVQLPLYACFALKDEQPEAKEEVGGLVFAKIRAKEQTFAGNLRSVDEILFATLKNTDALKKNPLTAEMLYDWRDEIERLAHEFVLGDAEVDPRQPPKTCERCELKVLCRVRESGDQSDEEEVGDE